MATQQYLLKDTVFQEQVAINLISTVASMQPDQAKALLRGLGGIHKLAQTPESVLRSFEAIGQKKAAKIRALTEWALLLNQLPPDKTEPIRAPVDVANLLMLEMSLLEREELRVVVLNNKNQIKLIDTIYQGSLHTSVVRVAEVFRSAIAHLGAGIVLVHNHPSGDPTPSPEDIRMTEIVCETGRLLDVDVLDHLVIGQNRFVSLKERGLGFGKPR